MFNMIKFQTKLIIKTPIMFMMFFVYPILLTAIIGYLAQGGFGGDVSSYEYYSVGMMIFMFAGSGLISVYNFLDDNVKSGNVRTMFSPSGDFSIFFSQIISGTIYSALASAFAMGVFNLVFKVDYNGSFLLILLCFIVFSFMSNALGMFLCTKMKNVGEVNLIFNLLQTILCVLGGAFFSLEALGGIPAMIAKFSPVKWFMDGILNSMYDSNNLLIYIAIIINLVLGLVLVLITSKTFKTEKYL
ncbi:MAG: ABC transporter permease [Clostridium sp.]